MFSAELDHIWELERLQNEAHQPKLQKTSEEENRDGRLIPQRLPLIDFLERNTGSVEINRNGLLERVFFERSKEILALEQAENEFKRLNPFGWGPIETELKEMPLSDLLQPGLWI